MFRRILVPLDGSIHCEQALPVAARLAARSGGTLILVRVINLTTERWPDQEQPTALVKTVVDAQLAAAQTYLSRQRSLLEVQGIEVQTDVLFGSVSVAVLSALRTYCADLIVLYHRSDCADPMLSETPVRAHGTAQTLIGQSPVPVFVVRDGSYERLTSPADTTVRPLHVLVALDGTYRTLTAIEPAIQLTAGMSSLSASARERDLLLLTQVIRPLHFSCSGLRSFFQQDDVLAIARRSLHETAQRLRDEYFATTAQPYKIAVADTVVASEDIAAALIEMSAPTRASDGCDIIVATATGYEQENDAARGLDTLPQRLLYMSRLPMLFTPPSPAANHHDEGYSMLTLMDDYLKDDYFETEPLDFY